MMDEKRLVDYFVVAGLPDDRQPLEEFANEAALKPSHLWDPIIDIAVINKSLGEIAPPGFTCLELTTTGFPADLNHGSLRAPEMYLCYKRGREKPPLTDIGVLYEGKERVMAGCEVLYKTPQWRPANVNNSSSSRIYITYRRADSNAASDTLAVTDICVILANKGETAPHAFCQISKTLNKAMMGSDIYLCYKKSMTKSHFLAFKPAMLDQFPLKDYNSVVLPPTVAMFCLPLGATIECWPAKANHPRPVFSTFVLTGAVGQRMYGAAVMFYESFDREKLTNTEREHLGLAPVDKGSPDGAGDGADNGKQIYQTKCICLLSHWPFFDTYKKFLSYIYKVSSTGPHQVPLERHISHFMMEVPFPSVQRPRILVQLNHEAVVLSQPEETPLPKSGASFTMMLKNLGPENCMRLLLYTQMEHKILIHSLRPAVLTSVAEASANMIFPFHWQCPYIPLCPLGLSEVLNAPCPFIVGIDSRYFDLYDPPSDVTCVDLDTNTVSVCDERKGFTAKVFPKKAAKLLKVTLERLYEELCREATSPSEGTPETFVPFEHDFAKKKKELKMETQIQEAFLRFTAVLLKGYSNYLLPITKAPTLESTDLNSLFDVHGFLKSRERTYQKYFGCLMKTQLFSRFIEERSFVSDKDASLVFFDECIEKVDERDDVRLIELDDNTNSERTVFISPPDSTGLPPGVTYSYAGFPKLNPDLFLVVREPTVMEQMKTPQRPRSPITKRSKQEMKSAQKMAQKHVASPILWAKCLLSHCYSLWFIHLPSYINSTPSKLKFLRVGFEVLLKMQEAKLQPPDELCYRVLMQMCGTHHQPAFALKILLEMKRNGVHPNAMTYGYYNKAVLESKWPSENTRAQMYWSRLRNVITAVSQFRRVLRQRQLSACSNSENDFDRISTDSFLEEFGVADKTDSATREISHAEPLNNEEKSSTGGMSDRGYNSMTLEDAKKISVLIGSKGSLDSVNHGNRTKVDIFHKDGCHKPPSGPVKQLFKPDSHTVGTQDKPRHFEPIRMPDIGDSAADSSSSTIEGSMFDNSGVDSTTGEGQSQPDDSTVSSPSGNVEATMQNGAEMVQGTSSMDSIEKSPETSTKPSDLQLAQEGSMCTASESCDPANNDTMKKATPSSNPTSPVHSIRVPVTDSEPLGVFSDPLLASSTVATDSSHQGDASTSVDSDRSNASSTARRNLLIDLEPFGSTVRTRSGAGCVGVEGRELRKSNSTGRLQMESFSSSDTSSPGSPLEAWSPMSSGPPPDSSVSLPPTTRASTLPEKGRIGLIAMPPEDKAVGRSESFSSALKSAASLFSSKFTELKQSMSTSTSATRGSSQSLSGRSAKLHETEKLLSESDEDRLLARASSNDCLSSGALRTSVSSNKSSSSSSSIKGASCEELALPVRGAVNVPYAHKPFVSDFLGGLMSMHLSPAIRGLATTWETVKDSMVESFSESWGISENSDYPYGWNGSDDMDSEEESSDEKGSSGDQVDDSDQSSLRSLCKQLSGSLYSLPHTLHNVAMDVEICSLSRCHSCNGLLYDEQIMAGWTAEDSNLNTSCQFCGSKLVPSLQISIKDYRQSVRPAAIVPSQSCESMQSVQSMPNVRLGQSAATPVAMTISKTGVHGNSSQPAVTGDDQDHTSKTWADPEAVKETLVSGDSDEKVGGDGKVIANDSNKGADTADSEEAQEGSVSESSQEGEGVKSEGEASPQKLIDLSPVMGPSQMSSCPESHIDAIMGDKLVDPSAMTESGHESLHLETVIAAGDKLIDLSPVADSQRPTSCLETDIDGATTAKRPAGWNPLLPPGDTSTTDQAAPPSAVCVNGVASDADIEQKLDGLGEEETSSPTAGNKTNDEQVSSSTGDSGTETDSCKIAGAVVDSNAASNDKKGANLAPGSEIHYCDKVDFGARGVALDLVAVHYLSPLVLRKELENIIEHEGEECLSEAKFVDDHPIVFWNLVWYFKRIEAPSHLAGFILTSESTNLGPAPHKTWLAADSQNVFVRAMWDNPNMHEGMGPPMYAQWNQATSQLPSSPSFDESPAMPRSLMQHIVSNIMCNDTMTPIKEILSERQRRKNKIRLARGQMHSLYRDILFLSFVALGHNNIDHDAFDREFRTTFMSLSNRDLARTHIQDRPPKLNAILCRRLFSDLEL